jgi:hypothetical protein
LAFYFFCVGSPKGCHALLFPKPNPRRQKQQTAVEAAHKKTGHNFIFQWTVFL